MTGGGAAHEFPQSALPVRARRRVDSDPDPPVHAPAATRDALSLARVPRRGEPQRDPASQASPVAAAAAAHARGRRARAGHEPACAQGPSLSGAAAGGAAGVAGPAAWRAPAGPWDRSRVYLMPFTTPHRANVGLTDASLAPSETGAALGVSAVAHGARAGDLSVEVRDAQDDAE